MAREEATVPIQLIESDEPVNCNVVFESYRNGEFVILRVEKPVAARTYAEIEVPRKTLDWIEDWLHDNWAEY